MTPAEPATNIYRFDITQQHPRYVGGGTVPGALINQYAMSEWNGQLRVATTEDWALPSGGWGWHSGIYVLTAVPGRLVQIGKLEGLGKGEKIYAVRFVGPVGYVVTFQTRDPLYTVDLHDPAAPTLRGELKMPGYSSYLHPVDETRLIGVGQNATDTGSTLGTQVSLFDVSDLANPARLARYTLSGAYSEAEVDPHAFLFWPATGLLVLPVQIPKAGAGALVLRLQGDQISEVGFVAHPTYAFQNYGSASIRRSLVTVDPAGDLTLWTVSDAGIQANDGDSLARLAWIPLG
jgi:uncharacterized secreted protein with C-terminal beta-propeller domain